jgi:hypothetical protein
MGLIGKAAVDGCNETFRFRYNVPSAIPLGDVYSHLPHPS